MLNRKPFISIVLGLAGVVGIALAAHGSASAFINNRIEITGAQGFALSPVIISMDISPGVVSEGEFRVRSTASETQELVAGIEPYSVMGENYSANFSEWTPRNEMVRWTNLDLTGDECSIDYFDDDGYMHFTVRSQEECYVSYTVDTPSDAPSGSQHASFFVKDVPKPNMTSTGVIPVHKIGITVSANNNSGDANVCGKVENQGFPFWVQEGPLNTDYLMKNCGNLDFYSDVDMEVYNLLGNLVYKNSEPVRKLIFAETSRRVAISWETADIGIYNVKQTVKYLGEEKTSSAPVFMIPIWLVIIILVILLGIIARIYYGRKNKKSKKKK
ncbi:hypothetical protein FACS189431_1200 [Alphaproteobacteria bacterium]|nr:hypothetical protein FACS189431_1200 [Alphaproteobacteria bacterium]